MGWDGNHAYVCAKLDVDTESRDRYACGHMSCHVMSCGRGVGMHVVWSYATLRYSSWHSIY